MADLDLATAKLHLRADGDAEDAVIALYLQAAQEHASAYLNRSIYSNSMQRDAALLSGDLTGIVATSAIDAAVLLICGKLYANREDVVVGASVAELPGGAMSLLHPYRIGLGV